MELAVDEDVTPAELGGPSLPELSLAEREMKLREEHAKVLASLVAMGQSIGRVLEKSHKW